eukprot:Skav229419  [mRNA]  locus=scaffold2297:191838:192815:+ [translate_table: standard]
MWLGYWVCLWIFLLHPQVEALRTEADEDRSGVASHGQRTEHADGNSTFVLYSIQAAGYDVEAVDAALDTWAAHLRPGQLQVVGMKQPEMRKALPAGITWHQTDCPDSHAGGACKDFNALANAWEKGADWVVLLGSDNYAAVSNIEAVLAQHSSSKPQVLGIRGCGNCSGGGLCGGGGQIFNHAALEQMMKMGRETYIKESFAEANRCGMWGDVSNCRVAFSRGVSVTDLPGLHAWHLDHQQLRVALRSKEPLPLTFHYLTADEMKKLHALIVLHPDSILQTVPQSGVSRWYQQREKYVAEEESRRWPDRSLRSRTWRRAMNTVAN